MKLLKQLTDSQRQAIKATTKSWNTKKHITGIGEMFKTYHEVMMLYRNLSQHSSTLIERYWFSVYDDIDELPCQINNDYQSRVDMRYSIQYIAASHKLVDKLNSKYAAELQSIQDAYSQKPLRKKTKINTLPHHRY